MTTKATIEVLVLPVADPDRSVGFYGEMIGFDLDVDYAPTPTFRVVQMTPPGSSTSIQFGVGLPDVPSAPVIGMYLVVDDIEAYRRNLTERGVVVGDIRHKDTAGGWRGSFLPGVDPSRADYATFFDFADPDGNRWVVQERS